MWTFGKKVTAGFALSFVLLVGVGVVAYQSITALAKTSYAVTHTHVVLEHLTSVVNVLKDAETGQRGFVITGDEAYLEPYRSAVDALPSTLEQTAQRPDDDVCLPRLRLSGAAGRGGGGGGGTGRKR